MSMVFILDGREIYSIPLNDATSENTLWLIDELAESNDVQASEITTKITR